MQKISRRNFLKHSGGAVVVPIITASSVLQAKETNFTGATLNYPVKAIGNIHELAVNRAVIFNYPDDDSPCALIKMGKKVPAGIGSDNDIVAYSLLCPHMGCPTIYSPEERTFKCPCHFSKFDCEKTGQMIIGQATENLPQILLSHSVDTGDISAIGVDGMIYGRQANIL